MKIYLLQEHLNNLCRNVNILNAYNFLEDAQREQAMLEDMYNNERVSLKEKHLPDKKYYSIIWINII